MRDDLKNVTVVYCGKEASEWYSLFCQTILKLDRSIKLLQDTRDNIDDGSELHKSICSFLDDLKRSQK